MKNLRALGNGWQKYCRVRGQFRQDYTEEKPSLHEVRRWVGLQHGSAPEEKREAQRLVMDACVDDYLESVSAMPSFDGRLLHMNEWKRHFHGRDPNKIAAIEIRTRLNALRKEYTPSSCNKRRTALMSFFTSLNGKSGYNPVRDVPKFPEETEPRAQSIWTMYRVLALIRPSKTRARLRVMLWTGWPHAQVKRLKPEHLDLARERAYVTPRRKGKGSQGRWLDLLPGAVIALRDFVKWDCFGPFSNTTAWIIFTRAVTKLNQRRQAHGHHPLHIRPYDLRHTFGTFVATHVTDERAIQELMMHSTGVQTRRYTEAATAKRVSDAVAIFRKQA